MLLPVNIVPKNETLPCDVVGCQSLRWGWNSKCRLHAEAQARRRVEAARKGVRTRERNFPSWRKPKQKDYEWWQRHAGRMVNLAKAAGVLPSLTNGDYACTDCGGVADRYDHRDYGRPLDVEPVCRACNVWRGPAKFPQAGDFDFKKR